MKRGYSLIELVVVLAIVGILIPLLFSISFIIVRTRLELVGLTYARREGERIKEHIVRSIRNGGTSFVTGSTCATELAPGGSYLSSMCYRNKNAGYSGFDIQGGKLIEHNGATDTALSETEGNDVFALELSRNSAADSGVMEYSSDTTSYVEFTVQAKSNTTMIRDQALTYRFFVTLRK